MLALVIDPATPCNCSSLSSSSNCNDVHVNHHLVSQHHQHPHLHFDDGAGGMRERKKWSVSTFSITVIITAFSNCYYRVRRREG